MKAVAYLAVSLDGYIADKNHGVDWLNEIPNPDQSDYGYAEFIESVDAIVMGTNTFNVVQSFGEWHYNKPVFVASNSIKEVPEGYEGRISLVQGEVREILAGIWDSGYERLYVDGGKLIQNCLQAGILDEIILTRIPIALGGGIPLFAEFENSIKFEHKKTEVVGVGLVKSHYLCNKGVGQVAVVDMACLHVGFRVRGSHDVGCGGIGAGRQARHAVEVWRCVGR